MPAFSTCTQCGYNADGEVAACPRCNAPMSVKQEPRTRAVILILCGLVLIGIMGPITVAMLPSLLAAGKDVDGSSFNGTAEQAHIILGLFGIVILFGLSSLSYGVYQFIYRRESKAFIIYTLVLVAVLIAFVYFTMSSLKPA
jgi:O-antigen/teichoic acid export membrane protein